MYKVLLRNNETLEEVWHHSEYEWNDFAWTEGNFGCNCNRHLFFERAKGNNPDFDDAECGEEKYSIVRVELLSY